MIQPFLITLRRKEGRKKEEGRRKKEEGRRKKEEGRKPFDYAQGTMMTKALRPFDYAQGTMN
jgi:hypothetical protein